MRVINDAIRRSDRAVVQMHLDALNKFLPSPDVTQMDVEVGATSYTLVDDAKARVEKQLQWAVAHQLPSPTSGSLPAIAPSIKVACEFFGVEMPDAPGGSLDTDAAGIGDL